jgi:hypothetical protein
MSQEQNSPGYARKGKTNPAQLPTDEQTQAYRGFYEHARAFSHRYLQQDPQDPNIHFGQFVLPYIQMFMTGGTNRAMQELLKSTYSIRDLCILCEMYSDVPDFIFETSFANQRFPQPQRTRLAFDDPTYELRSQTAQAHADFYNQEISRNLEESANYLRNSLPETERAIPPYIPQPPKPDGSIRWSQLDESQGLYTANQQGPGIPVWTFAPRPDSSIFISTPKGEVYIQRNEHANASRPPSAPAGSFYMANTTAHPPRSGSAMAGFREDQDQNQANPDNAQAPSPHTPSRPNYSVPEHVPPVTSTPTQTNQERHSNVFEEPPREMPESHQSSRQTFHSASGGSETVGPNPVENNGPTGSPSQPNPEINPNQPYDWESGHRGPLMRDFRFPPMPNQQQSGGTIPAATPHVFGHPGGMPGQSRGPNNNNFRDNMNTHRGTGRRAYGEPPVNRGSSRYGQSSFYNRPMYSHGNPPSGPTAPGGPPMPNGPPPPPPSGPPPNPPSNGPSPPSGPPPPPPPSGPPPPPPPSGPSPPMGPPSGPPIAPHNYENNNGEWGEWGPFYPATYYPYHDPRSNAAEWFKLPQWHSERGWPPANEYTAGRVLPQGRFEQYKWANQKAQKVTDALNRENKLNIRAPNAFKGDDRSKWRHWLLSVVWHFNSKPETYDTDA